MPTKQITKPSGNWLAKTPWMLAMSLGAAAGAYWVIRQRKSFIERWTPYDLPFSSVLLDVLAAPGGAALSRHGNRFTATDTGLSFTTVDGVPDFGGPETENRIDASLWFDTRYLLMQLMDIGWGKRGVPRNWLGERAAHEAHQDWCLVLPTDPNELMRLARNYPNTRFLCVDSRWSHLLETRRRVLVERLLNIFFLRANPARLPLKSGSMAAVFSVSGQEPPNMPELVRVTRPGGLLAGATFGSANLENQLEPLPLEQLEIYTSVGTLGFAGIIPKP